MNGKKVVERWEEKFKWHDQINFHDLHNLLKFLNLILTKMRLYATLFSVKKFCLILKLRNLITSLCVVVGSPSVVLF